MRTRRAARLVVDSELQIGSPPPRHASHAGWLVRASISAFGEGWSFFALLAFAFHFDIMHSGALHWPRHSALIPAMCCHFSVLRVRQSSADVPSPSEAGAGELRFHLHLLCVTISMSFVRSWGPRLSEILSDKIRSTMQRAVPYGRL